MHQVVTSAKVLHAGGHWPLQQDVELIRTRIGLSCDCFALAHDTLVTLTPERLAAVQNSHSAASEVGLWYQGACNIDLRFIAA